ncbi:response regulator [bacterium]|nr:response regulator [bacterium]MBU1990482.1 response regulator [bacterium]
MGIFSFFAGKDSKTKESVAYQDYFTKELAYKIIDTSDSMMMFFTKTDGWIGANKTFFDTFGLKNIDDFRNRYESVRELFLSESEEIFTEYDKSWLDYIKKYKKEGYQLTIYSKAENILHISAKCHTILHGNEFYVLELEDVSKMHQAEVKTKEIEKLKTKFLSNIGHEFRTPMNGILGFLELLDKTNLEKKQREYLQMIGRSSKNLMANIEILLDLSQMQGGRLTISNTTFSILAEMEKIAHDYNVQCRDKGLNLLTFIDPKLPKELNSDARKIKQIISSLINNAMKYTPRGGRIIVEVKLLKRQLNGDCSIGFSVKDNGKGIASEQIALINEPFTASSQADERLGIGLSLSHGLVNLLGGELKLQSEVGFGSYFNFVLNFKSSRGQSYKMIPKKKVKVLLLDNKKVDDANFLTTYLRSFAIDVVKANIMDENIYEGIDALYIVADQDDSSWMLKLGTYGKKVPIIILLDETQKIQTKLTHLVDEVLRKPLLPSTMAKHLNKVYHVEANDTHEETLKLKERISSLVVEDNLINQRLIKILLQEYNIAVSTAVNGNEAVSMCEHNNYDIVFMDIDMPEKNGIIATKEIKTKLKTNGAMPIVALTAMAMEGDKEMLLDEGLDDYISKPLTREKLEKILDKYLKMTQI